MEGVEWVWNNGKPVAQSIEEMKKEIENSVKNRKLNEMKKYKLFEKFLQNISKI
jgi:hypothetical protein